MHSYDHPPQALEGALELLHAGRFDEARRRLAQVSGGAKTHPAADYLQGIVHQALGDAGEASRLLRLAIGKDPGRADYHGALGDVLERTGDRNGARAAYDAALGLNPRSAPAALGLGRLLLLTGDASGSRAVLRAWTERPDAARDVLLTYGAACQASADPDGALAIYDRVLAARPDDPDARVARAAALVELERFTEAEAAIRAGSADLGAAPQAWLTLARALRGQGAFDAAVAAYRSAVAQPESAIALRELAELVWMTTGDLAQALGVLDRAGRPPSNMLELSLARAGLLEAGGDLPGAFALLSTVADRAPGPDVHMAVARLAMKLGDHERVRLCAMAAAASAPRSRPETFARCEALLACGRPGEAADLAAELGRDRPEDQRSRALLGAAWRAMGDPRYAQLFDYARQVRSRTLATPPGWASLPAYLQDLASALRRLHTLKAPPVGQSVRGGTQTHASLKHSDEPAIQAFFAAIDAPIRAYLRELTEGAGDSYRLGGIWSVRLGADGRHTDHIHPAGWLSTACYVALPDSMSGNPRAGWLKFGEPGVITTPSLAADHFVEPKAGELVIFPSYLWHGTVPFEGPGERLTVAFDILPT